MPISHRAKYTPRGRLNFYICEKLCLLIKMCFQLYISWLPFVSLCIVSDLVYSFYAFVPIGNWPLFFIYMYS
ncbi:hypothetical protein FKM82_026564 [Ascaphus truei]